MPIGRATPRSASHNEEMHPTGLRVGLAPERGREPAQPPDEPIVVHLPVEGRGGSEIDVPKDL